MTTKKQTLSLALVLLVAVTITCRLTGEENGRTTGPQEEPGPVATVTIHPPTVTEIGGLYYISTDGDDQSAGLTEETAFGTLGHALEVAQPGDTIQVLPGTYVEAVMLENIGHSKAPITIRGVDPTPVFDGQRTRAIGFWCENCTNLVFDNLTFQNYTDVGIGVSLCTQISMQNLVVHHNGFASQLVGWELEGYGIHVEESQQVKIENNRVYNNGPDPRPRGTLGTGINTYMCSDCIIRDNYSHDNIGGGILVEDGVKVLVEGNEIKANYLDATEDDWWDGGIWLDGGHDIIVRDNLFQNNEGPGIEISDEDHQRPYGYVLENNVSSNNSYGIYIWNFGTSDFPPENVLRMSNNRFTGNTIQDVWIEEWPCPPPEPCD